MNVAFLAQVYSEYIKSGGGGAAKRAKRYSCWSQTQVSSMPLHAHHAVLRTCAFTTAYSTALFASANVDLCFDWLAVHVCEYAVSELSPVSLDLLLLPIWSSPIAVR